ncbi:cyanamide hydratase, partial [Streptomyces sp. NPDC058964]
MAFEVAGVRAPTGRAARAAREVCAEYADEALYHHSLRSYFFGAAWARTRGLDFDRELLFVSAM